ncbi:MAG: S8 family serine peptidase [Myxococcales bacterium]|nr:S8 family serine peptidase [Myxococcales bacterium]
MNSKKIRTVFMISALSLSALAAARCQPSSNASGGNGSQGASGGAAEDSGVASIEDAAVASAADAGASASPWASLSMDDLRRMVREHAVSKLREHAPTLDVAQLAAYTANPSSAPELSGKAVDEVIHLALVALTAGNAREAADWVALARARARNRNSAFVANVIFAEAKRQLAGEDNAAQERALTELFVAMPLVRFQAATVAYQLYQRREQLDARLGTIRRAMVSPETAASVLSTDGVLGSMLRGRDRYMAAIAAARTQFESRPARAPYAFSTVNLAQDRRAQPVHVAVWDTGTNPELFRAQMFVNAREQANGRDDDNNNLVDDISGVASDPDASSTGLLYNPGADTITRYGGYLRGVMDLRAGMASTPAAQQVLALVRTIETPAAQEELDTRLDAIGEWAHGTHVAGIMLAGVPQARLSVFRSAWAGEARVYHHRGPTDAELDAEDRNAADIVRYINAHGVKVVNASLGFSIEYLEDELRHETDRYRTDAEVRARALAVQARRKALWSRVFRECPNTLFVLAAGNSNQDVIEYDVVAASVTDANNLLVVGAVDRYGDWALFTNSNPERVRVFDHGVEVDSVIPSGERVPLSGTSMASPNVANLAAKMLAVNPRLTPQQLITFIHDTGAPIAAPFNGRIAHEERAIARARRGR